MKRGDVLWVEFDTSVRSKVRKIHPAIIVSNDTRPIERRVSFGERKQRIVGSRAEEISRWRRGD